jgi:thioredoxin 1
MSITLPRSGSFWVICLCAAWCGVCRDYYLIFKSVAARYPDLRFAWVDIEDRADLVGDMDIETFPTLLLLDDSGVRFQGAVTPNPATTSRLIGSSMQGSNAVSHDASSARLLEALPALPDCWVGA